MLAAAAFLFFAGVVLVLILQITNMVKTRRGELFGAISAAAMMISGLTISLFAAITAVSAA